MLRIAVTILLSATATNVARSQQIDAKTIEATMAASQQIGARFGVEGPGFSFASIPGGRVVLVQFERDSSLTGLSRDERLARTQAVAEFVRDSVEAAKGVTEMMIGWEWHSAEGVIEMFARQFTAEMLYPNHSERAGSESKDAGPPGEN